MRVFVSAVVVLSISTSVCLAQGRKAPKKPGEKVATLSKTVDATWRKKQGTSKIGNAIHARQALGLASGRAELALEGGGTIALVGPCSMQWTQPYRAKIDQGKVEVRLSDFASIALDAPGFKMQSAGSKFDIDVGNRHTTISVIEGGAYIKTRGKGKGNQEIHNLEPGDSLRIDQSNGKGKLSSKPGDAEEK